jgi:hypothetical protein
MNIFSKKKRLMILGSPRSGTTWLAEIINSTGEYKYLFEPFHGGKVKEWKGLGFYPTISAQDIYNQPKRHDALIKIFEGDVDPKNSWVWEHGEQHKGAKHIMVKAVRAHYMTDAIQELFPDIKIIVILRKPVATIKSQIKSEFPHPKRIVDAEKKIAFVGQEKVDEFVAKCGKEDPALYALKWGIETRVCLDKLKGQPNSYFIQYEDLRDSPVKYIQEMFDFAGIDKSAEKHAKLSERKSTTTTLSTKSEISEETLQKIEEYSKVAVELFDLQDYA